MTVCVYALSSPGIGRIAIMGVSGERLRGVEVGSVIALVGEMSRAPRPTEDNLRKYDRVVQALARRTPALLPARYGTCVRDLYELALIVGARQDALVRRLKAVRHRVQMTVRVPHADVVRPTGNVRPTGKQGGGADYLRSRSAALTTDIPQFEPLRAAVRRWVREERVEHRGSIATVYHLVPRGSVDAYRRALEKKAHGTGARLMITGPWPPYAFSDIW